MDVLELLEKKKDRIIWDFLTQIKESITSEEEFVKVREMFLDAVNALYRESLSIIAAQKGVIIQSFEAIASQMLPRNFSIEKTVRETMEKTREPKKAREVAEEK